MLEIKDLLAQHFHKSCADLMVVVLDRTIVIAKISNLSSKILPKFGNINTMRSATCTNEKWNEIRKKFVKHLHCATALNRHRGVVMVWKYYSFVGVEK